MLYVCEKSGDKYGVKDTDDNVVEYVTRKQLLGIIKKCKLKINGVDKDGNITIFSPSSFESVIDRFFELMKRSGGGSMTERDDEEGTAAIRDWGDWVVPDYAYEDEDEFDEDEIDDYDYEELDPSWYKKLKEIANKLATKYPDLEVRIDTGEKNWIYLSLGRR